MLLKSCARCGRLIPYGSTYCEECRAIVDGYRAERAKANKRESRSKYEKESDPKYRKFYNSSAWRMLSAKYTQDHNYKCEECGRIATEVHHIEPIQTDVGWNKRLDYDNLELLCRDCHNKKHKRFKKNLKKNFSKNFFGGTQNSTDGSRG